MYVYVHLYLYRHIHIYKMARVYEQVKCLAKIGRKYPLLLNGTLHSIL